MARFTSECVIGRSTARGTVVLSEGLVPCYALVGDEAHLRVLVLLGTDHLETRGSQL